MECGTSSANAHARGKATRISRAAAGNRNGRGQEQEECSPGRDLQNSITKMEAKLSEMLKTKGTLDPAVRSLRVKLRDAYESLLCFCCSTSSSSSPFTPSIDVERSLWNLHYSAIKEFRQKMDMLKKKGIKDSQQMQHLVASCRGFLDESSGYLNGLIVKLRTARGLAPFACPGEFRRGESDDGDDDDAAFALSCHKLFVYIGDLARYKQLLGVSNPCKRDWSVASAYYRHAAFVYPFRGDPHNQLAYLAIQMGDEMTAMYHYCRSLAINMPFQNGHENLTLFLHKQRHHACKTPLNFDGQKKATGKKYSICRVASSLICRRSNSSEESDSTVVRELWECFEAHFFEMLRDSFSNSCLEELKMKILKSAQVLEELFCHTRKGIRRMFNCKGSQQTDAIVKKAHVLQMVVVLIFAVNETGKRPDNGARKIQLFTYFCHVLSIIITRAAKAEENEVKFLLPAVMVSFEWIVSQKSFLRDITHIETVGTELSTLKTQAEDLTQVLCQHYCPEKLIKINDFDHAYKGLHQTMVKEDYELHGFSPLSHAHEHLRFSNLCVNVDSQFSFPTYVERLMFVVKAFKEFIEQEIECLDSATQEDKNMCTASSNVAEEVAFFQNAKHLPFLNDKVQLLDKNSHSVSSLQASDHSYTPSGQDTMLACRENVLQASDNRYSKPTRKRGRSPSSDTDSKCYPADCDLTEEKSGARRSRIMFIP